uniref:Large ribosomal subunit protein uL3m n=1 Tax=Chromera velia CCMP2878 TaxID=1169474 RepID=A0A0G4GVQ4_9ALVE|mmetsp:Transcript_3447/g.7139  ORF Transcript_3447/g.7139 Transcript_3447/m.7139 type:complete len:358 (-) Transcript_3447:108-1181(-)|eukprot:Cvel_5278.t1-p1 / transcript=Cvel_5278.t1 / gene=Cvel_5278 / organism=Chromera_velia_CCMP2878 / gene_product=50S ribosomal protein L3-2, chloroplastic, putative / transcript_product=50S ribosomal protein L3-2, chloroplastic, putative / location=Cvel_scaffold244:9956-14257(+) / protein_length=357 / sequence_SO=supercontig / SO=protein_coding / is_pseudo=false
MIRLRMGASRGCLDSLRKRRGGISLTEPCEGALSSPSSFCRYVPTRRFAARRHFPSKWQQRLNRLLEPRRYRPPPEIPEFETAGPPHPELEKLYPIWSSRRTGVLAHKIGCMSLWDEWGERHFVTVCKVDRCVVHGQKTLSEHGYEALRLAAGYRPIERQKGQQIGEMIKMGIHPYHKAREIKCSHDCFLPVGHYMDVRHFTPGMWVLVAGWSKARGFTGPMARFNFQGQSERSTQSKAHRSHGSTGQRGIAGVWKFKKMAGHKGPDPVVVGAKIFRIETTRNLIFLRGAIPGHKGDVVKILDGRGVMWCRNRQLDIPYPTFIPEEGKQYPTTIQCPPRPSDPFDWPDQAIYEKTDG